MSENEEILKLPRCNTDQFETCMEPTVAQVEPLQRLQFSRDVAEKSEQDILACYQCGKCTAGCPVGYIMDYKPNQVMRLIQLGGKEAVLSSDAIWKCVSCYACTARCPYGINLARIMDSLKQLAIKGGFASEKSNTPVFNRQFLKLVRKYGRMHEASLVLNYNISTRQYFKEILKGPKMLLKNKLKLFPDKVKNGRVKAIFKKLYDQ